MNAVSHPSPLPAQPDFLPAGTRLRAMLPADLTEVMHIGRQAYEFPWSIENFASSLASGYLAECLLDADSGALLGYYVAMMGFEEMHLLNITVAPAEQGQGYGRALLHLLRVRSQQHEARKLWLEVRVSNPRARQLYESVGFEVVGTRRGYYPARGGREDAIVMGLDVTA